MTFVFKRVPHGPPPPGCYAQWQKNGSGLFADCCCPNGHLGSLRDSGFKARPGNHSVAPDGTVRPSYVCTEPGCGFHQWVKLDGWVPP